VGLWELRPYGRSRCAEHGEEVKVLRRVCSPHRGSHGRTARALKLLMSIGIPLENTKRPDPKSPDPLGEGPPKGMGKRRVPKR
jgi:hypothetical protein